MYPLYNMLVCMQLDMCLLREEIFSGALNCVQTSAALPSDAQSVGVVKHRSDQWQMINWTTAHASV